MTRIAVAGFQHETNTFAPGRTVWADFEAADSWPPLLTGAAVVEGTRGMNLPVAGFVAAAEAAGVETVPLLWCAAEPGAPVADEAFERIAGLIVDGLRRAGPLDGLYLDLHGAMVTESLEDGEAALVARLRETVGALPVAVSLDLHANISARLFELADAIAIYRTYPHLDMAETGARCLPLLRRVIGHGPLAKAFRQADFLVPLHAQDTGAEPCRGLYARLKGAGGDGVSADIAMGFTAADAADAGPSVVAYAPGAPEAEALADELIAGIAAAEPDFDCAMLPAAEAVRQAMAAPPGAPVVIADVQDNPGAGASSDTTGLLEAMVAGGAEDAVLALLCDAGAAAEAHRAGEGGVLGAALGGGSGRPGEGPYQGRFRVERLGEGRCVFTGEMYRGAVGMLGPTAVLRVLDTTADVRVVVSSQRVQCLDRAVFTHVGIDPAALRIVCVKSTVHFRADFAPIAREILVAEAPGGFPCRLDRLPYRRLRPGIRLGPLGPVFGSC